MGIECGWKKILTDHDQRSLKRLMRSNSRKTTVELRAMFNSKSKSISTRTMRRELKGLGPNSCIALRKPLISEANHKRLDSGAMEKVMWSEESKFNLFQSDRCIMVRREADEVMHPSCLLPTVQACGGRMSRFFHRWIFFSPRWQCHDSSGSNCERVVQGAWDIIFTHGLVTTESRP